MIARSRDLLRELAWRIQQIETVHRSDRSAVSTGIDGLDDVLPHGGLKRGALVEIFSAASGVGAWTLGVVIARSVCGAGKSLVITDTEQQFYAPAAVRWGIDLKRLIVVRPSHVRDVYHAVVQSLRCAAVGAVLGWHDCLRMADLRRLQLAAEAGGGVGILLRPHRAQRFASCAAVRLAVSPIVHCRAVGVSLSRSKVESGSEASERDFARRVQVDVVRCRGGRGGQSVILEIDDEAGRVYLPARMAPATVASRAARTCV